MHLQAAEAAPAVEVPQPSEMTMEVIAGEKLAEGLAADEDKKQIENEWKW